MWCVTVPTGAFVARTSAGGFVTGNSGFPKSLDVSKAIDKLHGAEREVVGQRESDGGRGGDHGLSAPIASMSRLIDVTAPATDDARKWHGWGTALSPAAEYWILARAPMTETVARNVLAHGTGAINIGATRTATGDDLNGGGYKPGPRAPGSAMMPCIARGGLGEFVQPSGRWPKNAVLSCAIACEGDRHSPGCPRRMLDEMSGHSVSRIGTPRAALDPGDGWGMKATGTEHDDAGGASRFFPTFGYYPKASDRTIPGRSDITNNHPTHKHPDLMRWLIRLVTPPGAALLDCFMGSGTTGVAAVAESVRFIGIEAEARNFEIARARILAAHGSPEYAAEANTTAPTGAQMVLL